jgi:hypothetical protein
MKFFNKSITAFAILLSGCSGSFSALEQGFVSPPEDIRTGVYWYWINDNISKEGVVKDLQAMKQAGITRAYIGNIGAQSYPAGKVKILSDEWWEVIHTALKTATELDIEIGIFNSPGWSQSGGPWIKPEQSMRYLAASELRVKGPAKVEQKLPKPDKSDFQDVKVIAFPVSGDYRQNLFTVPDARVLSDIAAIGMTPKAKMPDGRYSLPVGKSFIGLALSKDYTARSLAISACGYTYIEVELQVKDGSDFKTVKRFLINRTNSNLHVGFDPYAPVVIALPEITASAYRIVFNNLDDGEACISDVVLSSTPVVERYPEKTLAKMFQAPLPYWHDYMWDKQPDIRDDAAIAKPEQTLDISKFMAADGTLSWDAPEGEWLVLRTGMTSTGVTNSPASPEGTGLEVDKMSKTHVAYHFNSFIGEILKRVPPEDRKTWRLVVEDSYETGGQNFTDGFFDDFKARYGYDALPFLPVFSGHVIGSPDLSDRFLWDVRRMIADKVAYDYVGGLKEISNKHGLRTWLQNYGHWGFPAEFLQYGGQSDEVSGEFWSEGELGDIENRAASSCAHIYGKPTVSAESFTCGGNAYGRYPAVMKRRGDWSFTEGINNTLLHLYIQQAYEDRYPGIDEWFGNEFNRRNTWFKHIDLFILYLKRCNFMLRQGLNVADAAYFIGEDAPKMTGIRNPEIPKGYSFDYINAEVIIRDLSVKDGRLTLPHGTSYSVLVLPPLETMRPEVLLKIEQLVAEGAVVLGNPPSRSPSMKGYPDADGQVKALAQKMWGEVAPKKRAYGKGTILSGMTMTEVFDLLNLPPDCRIDDKTPILYNHRTLGDGREIYFLTNQSEQRVKANIAFRVTGLQPELWDAVSGAIRPLPSFEQTGETTVIPIQLESLESAFIVFRKTGSPSGAPVSTVANFPETQIVKEIDSPWEVSFDDDAVKRGPGTVKFDKLTDWSKHENEQIRYYSGTAVYKTVFTLDEKPADNNLYIDLGRVGVMAKVKLNDRYIGGIWTAPYRVNAGKYLKKGDNVLEIEVVNTWVNRIVGDLQMPPEKRLVVTDKLTQPNTPLQTSGLLGPVTIVKN